MKGRSRVFSIELVPRDLDRFAEEVDEVCRRFKQFEWLNIPDIKRLPVRSHEAALAVGHTPLRRVPHLRARDRSIEESLAILRSLVEAGVGDVLIVSGDPSAGENEKAPTSLDVLRAAKDADLRVRLWAAFDPYRGDLRAELDYVQAKLEAGAVGLFTQPFFDLRMAEICLEQLEGIETFVGISPVTSEKSREYWERTNRVVFPPHFEATLEYCARLGGELIRMCQSRGQHVYLMPIRVDAVAFIEATFACAGPVQPVPMREAF